MIKSKATKTGDIIIAVICFLLMFVCLVPMLNVLARSFSSADALIRNEVLLWPKGWNFDAYTTVLRDAKYVHSLWYTALLTVGCPILSMVMTIMCAYPLTYDNLKGGKVLNGIIVFTMYFSAGTIPHYLLLRNLGMLDTVWSLILPSCLSVYNMIIMRSFFYGVPDSLREAAEIDGAGPVRTLVQIYLPLSTSVLATLALFYAVGRWNGFSDALMYIKKRDDLAHPAAPVQHPAEHHLCRDRDPGRLQHSWCGRDAEDGHRHVRDGTDPAGVSVAAALLRDGSHYRRCQRLIFQGRLPCI